MEMLNEQELHRLAMNIVGKQLESDGFEFLGVNSKLGVNPQFVCLRNKKLHFIVVKAVLYPDNPVKYDLSFMETIREHALKFKARTYYAGVGIANAEDYEKPVIRGEKYIINYDGIQEID
ncbi:Na(+)-translocating NADH-quinone reductase subunit F [Sinomicrobium soli]|uniref:Na(+)-translocating NADH-quinone reductase subunit F n=1 Tax=Sinomicrobium sp. N-1-3-6 TaxID=2219864 RepID=UPI000DCF31F4|nr:Na(+)-translocating NADH-quinone reductase subunit F [Sinomicrobium sp. N-1-3-6]RAV28864.1 Na(+)-translocating NADH-quinone reductase subunit F [Sinomicrobium sp. N-1-3-6]